MRFVFSSLPTSEPQSSVMGSYVTDLHHLVKEGKIPLAPHLVITKHHLEAVIQETQILPWLNSVTPDFDQEDEATKTTIVRQLSHHLRHLTLPMAFSSSVAQAYHQQLAGDYVALVTSQFGQTDTPVRIQENIKGEANLLQSILEEWANLVTLTPNQLQLYPAAFMIQRQPQPELSGIISTFNPATGSKTQISITATPGVTSDTAPQHHYLFDVRTGNVVTHQTAQVLTKKVRTSDGLKTQPVTRQDQQQLLSPAEIQALAQAALVIKHQSLHHFEIEWYRYQQHLYLTRVTALTDLTRPQVQPINGDQAIVIGHRTQSGYVEGQCGTDILVVAKLTKKELPLLKQAAGLICEQSITDHQCVSYLQHYHVPTITQAKFATKLLKNGQTVKMDASSGKVYKASLLASSSSTPTITKVFPHLYNPYHLTPEVMAADGWLLHSDLLLAFEGQHPLSLTTRQQDQLIKTLGQQLSQLPSHKPLWYCLQGLSNHELSQLRHGEASNLEEVNPWLGEKGALRLLDDNRWLTLELALWHHLSRLRQKNLPLVVSWVRTPSELHLLLHLLKKFVKDQPLEIWWEINTPANLIQLEDYPVSLVSGLILSLSNFQHLSLARDPDNSQLYHTYPSDAQLNHFWYEVFQQKIKTTTLYRYQQHQQLPLIVETDTVNHDFLMQLDHQLLGLAVKQHHYAVAKQLVQDREKNEVQRV